MNRTARALCVLLAALAAPAAAQQTAPPPAGPWWSRGGVCYEIFVRSFFDSDGDGIGDLRGLTQKLDYVNDGDPATRRDLGASCIWLMPVAESPSYHGYDVTDYYRVESDYGSNDDFRAMVAEAHRRGIRVLVDLVLNHASSRHPHFQAALSDPASPYRGWFRFSPSKPEGKGPWGQEVWHRSPSRDEFYYGVFTRGMPDLNYESPAVREEAGKIARFWLEEMGVDGFRLDAIPYIAEEGGRLAHTPRTHALLREFGAFVREAAPHAFTVGEVWDSTGAVLPYYPDQLDSYFAFEVADGILEAVRAGAPARLHAAVQRLQRDAPRGRWSPFLRNHDQTRTMTELRGNAAQARLAATLLLTLPGTPFVYYGEELGMTGDKPDPRLRTPLHWTRGPGAGFSRGKPWAALHPDSLTASVEAQDADPGSLLNHYRALVHLRAAHPALGAGDYLPLDAGEGAAAYLRREGERAALVLVNLTDRRLTGVTLSSAGGALPAGRYAAAPLLGGPAGAPLIVGADGRLAGWAPLPALEPGGSHLFDLRTP